MGWRGFGAFPKGQAAREEGGGQKLPPCAGGVGRARRRGSRRTESRPHDWPLGVAGAPIRNKRDVASDSIANGTQRSMPSRELA